MDSSTPKWKIPLSDIQIDQAEIDAVTCVLKSGWLSMGAITQQFEKQAADYLDVKYAFAVANGTAALHLAHAALGIGPGDEAITPSLTFVATANSIVYTGATPIFADVCSLDDLTISPEDIIKRLSPRTRAITVMHYAGFACRMAEIIEIARAHNLAVIEDAAHAPGGEISGRKLGTIGDVGCFSFFANKNLVTGEGGLVATNRDDLAERIRLMRSHGMTSLTWDRHLGHAQYYDVLMPGYNYRIDEIRSAIGIEQLRKLPENNARRAQIVEKYHRRLADISAIRVPFTHRQGASSHHLFVILLEDQKTRARVIEKLRDAAIQTSIHYPPIHRFKYYREMFPGRQWDLPLTEHITQRVLTLPLYPSMTDEQVDLVIQALHAALQ